MGGTLTVSVHLNDITDAHDAVENGTLMALLNAHRSELNVQTQEDDETADL